VVFLVLIAAAGIFSVLAQSSLRSLRSLIRAADEVQVGNMKPWLPPPGVDEVGRLAMAFRKMTDRLDESIRQSELNQKLAAVGELASYLSHEIRNPLSSIRLGLQTLHRDLSSGFIPPDASRIIEISLNEVKRLNGVVQTVLEVGRDRGEIDKDTVCDVHASIAAAVDVIMPKTRSKGVDLDFFPTANTPWVVGDPDSLRGVWLNLIVNALDALEGQRDGRILISTRQAKDGDVHIRVADNGPGVPPYALGSIFEPFYTTKDQGNGIGLATASATLQSFGGVISYDEQASVDGAVFLIRLKRARSPGRNETEGAEDAVPAYDAVGTA
jgi:signal transduction histidine kinase